MARLGAIKRNKKAVKKLAQTKTGWYGRTVNFFADVGRNNDGGYSTLVCPASRGKAGKYTQKALEARARRGGGGCGYADAATPTKSITKALRNLALKLSKRK
jgi:hypothetical protein